MITVTEDFFKTFLNAAIFLEISTQYSEHRFHPNQGPPHLKLYVVNLHYGNNSSITIFMFYRDVRWYKFHNYMTNICNRARVAMRWRIVKMY